MSYDLTLYFRKAVPAPDEVQGDTWQIVTHGPMQVEDEDLPPGHAAVVGTARQIWQVHLEGERTPEALGRLEALLSEAMARHRAVVVDEQAGRWQTARKTGALVVGERAEPETGGAIRFFFEDGYGFHPARLPDFLDALARHLPGAVPVRFGPWEPLQFKVTDGDTSDLAQAWAEDPGLLMKCATPFDRISAFIPCAKTCADWAPDHKYLKAGIVGHITLYLRPKAFSDPALIEACIRFMQDAAAVTGSFYAELRNGKGQADSWFWRGLPPGPVNALVLGPPYAALWPEAAAIGTALPGGRVLLRERVGSGAPPSPPEDLLMPPGQLDAFNFSPACYARTFPFERPR